MSDCTNPQAYNYNPSATVDDGSCQFPDFKTKIIEKYCETSGDTSNTNPFAGTSETGTYSDFETCHYFITMTPIDIFQHFWLVLFFFVVAVGLIPKVARWLKSIMN